MLSVAPGCVPDQVLRDEMIGLVVYLSCELVLELLPPGLWGKSCFQLRCGVETCSTMGAVSLHRNRLLLLNMNAVGLENLFYLT